MLSIVLLGNEFRGWIGGKGLYTEGVDKQEGSFRDQLLLQYISAIVFSLSVHRRLDRKSDTT